MQLESTTQESNQLRNMLSLAWPGLNSQDKLTFQMRLKELDEEANVYKLLLNPKGPQTEKGLQESIPRILNSLDQEIEGIESQRIEWGTLAEKQDNHELASAKYGNPWRDEYSRLSLISAEPQGHRNGLRLLNNILNEPKQVNVGLLKY